ncbi:hypothetical protein C7974DRAFT_407630 [Boeremia exigua]|uniref:uncharacterized protein n=1 Tax=Boeremia exigua TaxID=749465 RepID=UPI001E8D4D96|nr:uncharacterized protein C7974DRAFT_407630 [Boeremia exigua]KAH6643919.1 hypothetical protein C7974DRAFT_407630 [Boeremia exigua]
MGYFTNFTIFADHYNRALHIAQAVLVLGAFIVGCALMADTSMQRSRSTTLVLVYSIKSAIFLLYVYLSTHTERFQRFASLKANFILDTLDCLLWFTAFIISCMGGGRCAGSSCALLGVAATLAIMLASLYFVVAVGIDWVRWRAGKAVAIKEQV